jgi:hypothetical protein
VRLAALVALISALAYVGVAGYLRFNERGFVYLPADRAVPPPAASLALAQERVSYPSSDGVSISAWVVPAGPTASVKPAPAQRSVSDTALWLLICHGNFGSIGFGQRPEFYAFMRDLGVNLLAFDYRGYGDSTGTPDEQGLYADAAASYDYLTRTRGIPPEAVVIFGHSLGSGVAIELASRVPAAGLIVDGAFTSVVDRAQEIYPLLPIGLIATQRFPSLDRIRSIRSPKLFLHSPEDAVIPIAHGRRLFEAAPPPKRFVQVRGGHDNAYRVDREVYYGAIGDLLRGLADARSLGR